MDELIVILEINVNRPHGLVKVSMADPRVGDAPPPRRSKFFHFHGIFGKKFAKQ